VVVATFHELVAVAQWFGFPETEERTVAKAVMMTRLLKLLNWDWAWLGTHQLWLPEILTELVWHSGGNGHHGFLLLDYCYILFSFWESFGTMTPPMIFAVKVWISWIMILNFQRSSSSLS
jgi:hypothetical protein